MVATVEAEAKIAVASRRDKDDALRLPLLAGAMFAYALGFHALSCEVGEVVAAPPDDEMR